jgi:hypothetical protein
MTRPVSLHTMSLMHVEYPSPDSNFRREPSDDYPE